MYSVGVRAHIMIAHSFRGELFGPAQKVHGATYVVDVDLFRPTLDPDGLVVDIARLHRVLDARLAAWNYKNLDEIDEFAGMNTTTEFLAGQLHGHLARAIYDGDLGPHAGGIERIRVVFHESHIARAGFEGPV